MSDAVTPAPVQQPSRRCIVDPAIDGIDVAVGHEWASEGANIVNAARAVAELGQQRGAGIELMQLVADRVVGDIAGLHRRQQDGRVNYRIGHRLWMQLKEETAACLLAKTCGRQSPKSTKMKWRWAYLGSSPSPFFFFFFFLPSSGVSWAIASDVISGTAATAEPTSKVLRNPRRSCLTWARAFSSDL